MTKGSLRAAFLLMSPLFWWALFSPVRDVTGRHEKHPHGRGEDVTGLRYCQYLPETPPRTWGRRYRAGRGHGVIGNTPTDVGKTIHWQLRQHGPWKHPHGRGEDPVVAPTHRSTAETPPRTWGRPQGVNALRAGNGNTPTDVGKTGSKSADSSKLAETPPRTWGRLCVLVLRNGFTGNTPTDVGKTISVRS